ncbi:MAG: hypothetical protein QNJ41_11925 [Xenococcaceae cyanobacterium MO_188.B32]|nr:hypothetical protein [Xenococcaceae cyanobacterium MO_188.B32]
MKAQDREEIKQIVVEVLLEMLSGRHAPKTPDIEYLPTSAMTKFLGYTDNNQLYRLIQSGVLRIGQEVQDRRAPTSSKADYYFNKQACLKRLNEKPEKRA